MHGQQNVKKVMVCHFLQTSMDRALLSSAFHFVPDQLHVPATYTLLIVLYFAML